MQAALPQQGGVLLPHDAQFAKHTVGGGVVGDTVGGVGVGSFVGGAGVGGCVGGAGVGTGDGDGVGGKVGGAGVALKIVTSWQLLKCSAGTPPLLQK